MNDLIQTMISKTHESLKNAYAPYSNFLVSACVCSEDDILFTGVNMENSAYGLSLCAETSGLTQMITAGYRQIKHLVIMSSENTLCPPCGACRQRIYEFSTPNTQIHLCSKEALLKTYTIDKLLPLPFSLRKTPGNQHA